MTPNIQKPHKHQKKDNQNPAHRVETAIPAFDGLMLAIHWCALP